MTTPWQSPDQTPGGPPVPPAPRYGEMAPPGYVSPVAPPPAAAPPVAPPPVAPGYGAPTYYAAPPVRKSRTADVAITCVLLGLGLVGMLIGVFTPLTLSSSLATEYAKYGLTYSATPALAAQGAVIAISHVVLYLAVLGASIPLLIKRRLAFWVPLTGGVVAAIFFWGVILAIIFTDSRLMDAISASH